MTSGARLLRHRFERARDCSKNRSRSSAAQERLTPPVVSPGQRNLRNSSARFFKSSALIFSSSAGIAQDNRSVRCAKPVSLWMGRTFRRHRFRRFETENGFAFFHEIEPVACDRLQISRISFQETYLEGLPAKNCFLLVHLRLESIDFGSSGLHSLIRRNKKADHHQP